MSEHPNGDTPPRAITAHARATIGPYVDHAERLKKRVLTDETLDATAEAIRDGLKPRRPCGYCNQRARVPVSYVRVVRDMAEGVGVRVEVDARILAELGVPIPEARRAVEAVRDASELEPEGHFENAMALLESVLRLRPELRERAISRIQATSFATEEP